MKRYMRFTTFSAFGGATSVAPFEALQNYKTLDKLQND